MNLKNGKVFTIKSVGTGPSSYEKRIYRAAVSQRLRNTGLYRTQSVLYTKLQQMCLQLWKDYVAELLLFLQGLFSRITFREPLFVGGPGNTTGLTDKLPTEDGLKGCIRHLEVNDHIYSFNMAPGGDSVKGFDVGKYSSGTHTTDKGGVCFYLQAFCSCICMCMSVGMSHLQENTWPFFERGQSVVQ